MPGLWVHNALWRSAKAVPSLDLRFADSKSLVDSRTGQSLITFTRASSATFIDSAGTLQTAATDVPRFDHNPTTGESLGLLVEEARTNLLLNSGTLSTQSATVTAVAHTLHFTGTGTITLTGASTAGPLVGTGTGEANRVSLTFTPTAGSLTLTVSGTVTNAQLEAGAFRTSYIATAGATATRAADVASITGANFSSWYRQDEGTVFARYSFPQSPTAGGGRVFQFTNAAATNLIWLRAQGGVNRIYDVTDASVSQASFNQGAYAAGIEYRAALAAKANDFGFAENGGASQSDSSGTMPSVDRAGIGMEPIGNGSQGNVHIRRLTYWPQRLSNSTLQTITQ
jgi:hypothetical protein